MTLKFGLTTSPVRLGAVATMMSLAVAGAGCGGEDAAECALGVCGQSTAGDGFPQGDAGASTGGPAATTSSSPTTGGGTTGSSATGTTGTGTTGTSGQPTTTTGAAVDSDALPCDIKEIVDAKCGKCHSDPPMGTYMSLVSKSDFDAPSTTDPTRSYGELAIERLNDPENPMPPAQQPQLTDAELATLSSWLQEGAPAGTEECGGDSGGGNAIGENIDTTGLDCVKFLAHADGDKSAKFPVGVAVDAYYDMTFDAPWQGNRHAVVFKPITDNAKVLHHWILYRQPGAGADGQVRTGSGQHGGGEMIYGWAPGGTAVDFRRHGDVGAELPQDTYLMEFHYNSDDASAMDASGIEVCFLPEGEEPEHIAGLSWLGYDHGIEGYLAGGVLGTAASDFCLSPAAEWTGTCAPVNHNEPIHLMFVQPHLHEAGRHIKAVINSPDGSSRVLHDMPFDFDYQIGYEVEEVLMPGETITTTCTFSEPKCAGQATGAEMCYLYTYAYPKGALRDDGEWGTFAHGDNVCLGQ